MSTAFLSIGSNLGNRMGNLKKALSLLSSHPSITVVNVSSVYETDPVGFAQQDDFLNLVCKIETDLSPIALLLYTQTIEQILFRERTIRFGPRTIDVDILTYDAIVMQTDELFLPHPRMSERAFVQIPLHEILDGGTFKLDQDPSVRYFGTIPDNCWLKHL
ncbi:MAG: 2-amino-4-hydroxy-6-hydroxymethyldihydropteridine diphosphokinase [Eubacteriales bacterium]